MNTKLTLTFALAASTVAGRAHAYDTLDGSDMGFGDTLDANISFDTKLPATGTSSGDTLDSPDQQVFDKLQLDGSKSMLDALWNTAAGKLAAQSVESKEPVIDKMDPGAGCKDIQASKSFYMPLHSDTLAGQKFSVGFAGEAKLIADADQLGVQALFAPAAEVFDNVVKPVDIRLTASTNNVGLSSLDLGFYAFGYEIDSFNIASTSSSIEHVASYAWSLPDGLRAPRWGSSFDCSIGDVVPECTLSWGIGASVVADVSAIIVLRVNSNGIEAHTLAAASSHLAMTVSGSVTGKLDPPVLDPYNFTATATGSAALNIIHSLFTGRGVLAPHDSRWVAAADYTVNVEDVLRGKAQVGFEALSEEYMWDLYDRKGENFNDAFWYQCTFDKQFK